VETIYFEDSHGRKLCGVISNRDSQSAVLMCHGLGSHKDDMPYLTLQDKINDSGVATFRMDLLGHGGSEGDFNDLTLSEAIDDILCAKHELERRGYSRVGFIGSSFGGVGGIMVASKEDFHFLVLISPPTHYDVNEMIKSGIYILRELKIVNKITQKKKARPNIKFFRDYGSHDSYIAAKKISSPVLIIQGDKDKIVPLVKTKELHNIIRGSKIKIFKGANHQYTHAQGRLVKEIMLFVKKQKK